MEASLAKPPAESAPGGKVIHVRYRDQAPQPLHLPAGCSAEHVRGALYQLAGLPADAQQPIRLTRPSGVLLPIGPSLPPNEEGEPYQLVVRDQIATAQTDVEVATSIMEDIMLLQKKAASLVHQAEMALRRAPLPKDPVGSPAQTRIREIGEVQPLDPACRPTFPPHVLEELQWPTFDIWAWKEEELIYLMEAMLEQFGLFDTFKIPRAKFELFMRHVQFSYNGNPFHNFKHCFCVTQMMYALLHVTGVHAKLSSLEKLALLVAAIGHDLDHPGFNNAYQVNAATELAIIYNDMSPLENHHCAMLFTLLRVQECNFISGLTDPEFRELRKIVILCILATDMAKHGEILGKFKACLPTSTGALNLEEAAQKQLLFQMLIKCSDISNEVRPKLVSEPWVDRLLEEFFHQSDTEKAAGLPTAPFMDRQKVTKGSAQVGFINFVMLPLYEALGKALPNVDEHIVAPIRSALQYYTSLNEAGTKTAA